jgi:valyl-tRNA synthetase
MALEKAFDPKNYEHTLYERWESSGFFNPDNLEGEPYSIMIPPPNVTGVLHLGHALEHSLMDTMARYQRMNGKKVLLLPGTDHAAVATQAKVERMLVDEGMKDPRTELGRDGLVDKIRAFAEQSKGTILAQIKKMGSSFDWSRLRYTFDEDRNRAVNEMFVRMYDDGLIYRGTRLINWSVGAQSVLSDDELEWEDRKEPFYYIRCGKFIIGTVRSETKCADSPLVVHPDGDYVELSFQHENGKDDVIIVSQALYANQEEFARVLNQLRPASGFTKVATYKGKDLDGQRFEYETYAGPRTFTILSDEMIDIEKGTGAMTISTHHSADDYDLAERRGLKDTYIDKLDFSGKMTAIAGTLEGIDREKARKESVKIMKEKGLIAGIDEDYVHSVPFCYRTKTVIEPMVSTQWFVSVHSSFVIKQSSLQGISGGDEVTLKQLMSSVVKSKEVTIAPERFEKTYFHWVDNLRDWCISRQIWWGHRIPVWYCTKKSDSCDVVVSVVAPQECPTCKGTLEQDPDTLDTWFSSGLWTFSTLGWPDDTKDLQTFHPSNWMQMGYEILFFWMARMIMMSTYALGEVPFHDVYIHGMLRDKNGKKFSKSSGNGIDPIDVINEFGTDALRISLLTGISPGNDSKFYTEKVQGARHLVNKIWNIARFMLLHIDTPVQDIQRPEPKTAADQWVLWKLDQAIESTNRAIQTCQFSQGLEGLREFTWAELADWYLEMAKSDHMNSQVVNYVLNTLLRLWHPYAPFVTEAIWQETYGEDALLLCVPYPKCEPGPASDDVLFVERTLREVVTAIRSLRAEKGIAPGVMLDVCIVTSDKEVQFKNASDIIQKLARLQSLNIGQSIERTTTMVTTVAGDAEIMVDLAGVVDFDVEKGRLQKEIDVIAPYAASQEKKLANKEFTGNAPKEIVTAEKKKLFDAQEKMQKLQKQLSELQ